MCFSTLLTISQDSIGGAMGLSASIGSLTRVLAPSLGGLVFEKYSAAAPGNAI